MNGHLCFDGEVMPSHWPSVSLCMIVKNEAAHLAACLESVQDLVNEIIIVDTGSTDGTVAIAQSFGAKVLHFTWVNDFAAARNESIREATGEWIIWMDADDRLAPDTVIRLKQAVASGQADAFYCYVISRLQDENVGEDRIEHLRLFRNRRGVAFESPLHEDAAPAASRLGLTIARTNIMINHTGYATSREVLLEKAWRNLPIIEAALQQRPDSLHWRFHLGVTLHVLSQFEAAIEHLEAVVADPPPTLDREVYIYQAYEGLMLAYTDTGQADLAELAVRRALAEFSHRQHCWIRAATIYLALDEPIQAVDALIQAGSLPRDTHGQSWAPGTIETHLTQAYLLLGDVTQARTAYLAKLAKTGQPTSPTFSDAANQTLPLLRAKQYRQVVEFLQPVSQADPAALRLLAEAHAALQGWEQAAQALAAAMVLAGPELNEWTTLAKYTLKAKDRALHARRFCHLALAEDDQDAEALNLLGIIALAQQSPSVALAHFVDAVLADPKNRSARNNFHQACRSLHLQPADVVRRHGLQLIKQAANGPDQAKALAALGLVVELAPQDAQGYKLMAVVLQKMNREEEALSCWQSAQALESRSLTQSELLEI